MEAQHQRFCTYNTNLFKDGDDNRGSGYYGNHKSSLPAILFDYDLHGATLTSYPQILHFKGFVLKSCMPVYHSCISVNI